MPFINRSFKLTHFVSCLRNILLLSIASFEKTDVYCSTYQLIPFMVGFASAQRTSCNTQSKFFFIMKKNSNPNVPCSRCSAFSMTSFNEILLKNFLPTVTTICSSNFFDFYQLQKINFPIQHNLLVIYPIEPYCVHNQKLCYYLWY